MKTQKLYICAGRAIEAINVARARNLSSADFVYITHADVLRGADRRPRVLCCGTWRSRPDCDLIRQMLRDRGAIVEEAA